MIAVDKQGREIELPVGNYEVKPVTPTLLQIEKFSKRERIVVIYEILSGEYKGYEITQYFPTWGS